MARDTDVVAEGARRTADGAGLFELDPQVLRCPYPVFEEWRHEAPVQWSDAIEAFAVTRYEDVTSVLRRPELFSSSLATGPVLSRQLAETIESLAATDAEVRDVLTHQAGRGATKVLLNADPPLHSRQRALVNRAFTPARVRDREPMIRQVAMELIDRFCDSGEVELIREFAVPLPLTVIAHALGVPVERMDDFKRWSDDFVAAIGNHHMTSEDSRRMVLSQAEFFDYFAGQIRQRRQHPSNDMISDVVAARIDGEELTEPEMLSMFSQFLVAGNETTTKLLGSALLWLTRDPALADRLRRDPEQIRAFVEEVLRLETPVQGLFRQAVEDCEVGGVNIPAGASLWLAYASANRDDSSFPHPDQCDLDRRSPQPHLSFGLGEHFCLGAALARAEARIGLDLFLARCGDIRLTVPEQELEYEPSYALHGLRRLPLRFTPTTV